MKKVCSYCQLTKEHTWPASIVRKVKERGRYSSQFKRISKRYL